MSAQRPVTTALWLLAVSQLGLGLWMALAPGPFFDALGPFGARNDHYVRDVAAPELALGVVALLALRRPPWRAPVILLAALWFGFHAVNHAVDIGAADPKWVGVFDFLALAAASALLGWIAALAGRVHA